MAAAGWQTANAAGGVNVNLLASSDPGDLELLAGMARLNGIPIRIDPVGDEPVAVRGSAAVAAG